KFTTPLDGPGVLHTGSRRREYHASSRQQITSYNPVVERRTFIIGALAGGIGLAEYSYVTGWMNHLQDPKDLSVKAYEKYGDRAALVAITPNEDFYVTSKGFTPHVKLEDWRLKFDGLVERPLTFDYKALLALPKIEKYLTLEC